MRRIALITGITGQDGYYLADLLLKKNYEVYGTYKHQGNSNYNRFKNDFKRVKIFKCDNSNYESIYNLIDSLKPNEIYNLAAQSSPSYSFQKPLETYELNSKGVLNILEAIRNINPSIKFMQASTSELYANSNETPQTLDTEFYPINPYGVSKLCGFWITKNYREAYDIFASNGILYNHESPLRSENFVIRKITLAVSNIKKNKQKKLYLGNLDAKRDWGYAKDYVNCMWGILQAKKPDDYIISTGETHSVREICELAFNEIGIELKWEGNGINEKGINKETNEILIEVKPEYYKPSEKKTLCGDSVKLKNEIKCNPNNTNFKTLIKQMVQLDLNRK